MTTLGFVVLAKRPNPYAQHPWDCWTIGPVFASHDEAQAALDDYELSAEIDAEQLRYAIDRDSKLPHRHHSACIHNLTTEKQIEARGRTMAWWREVHAAWPEQITPEQWEREPPADPVEYEIGPVFRLNRTGETLKRIDGVNGRMGA